MLVCSLIARTLCSERLSVWRPLAKERLSCRGLCWRSSRTNCTSLLRSVIIYRYALFPVSPFDVSLIQKALQLFHRPASLWCSSGFPGLLRPVRRLFWPGVKGHRAAAGLLRWQRDPHLGLGARQLLELCESRRLAFSGLQTVCWIHRFYDGPRFIQTPMKDLYHQLNSTLGAVHLANNSSFFCPLTLRGGLGRRPSSPTTFPLLNCDVRASLCLYLLCQCQTSYFT